MVHYGAQRICDRVYCNTPLSGDHRRDHILWSLDNEGEFHFVSHWQRFSSQLAKMAHFESGTLTKPTHFNFAQDVVDYWASKPENLQAMYWISQDYKTERVLSYVHFKTQSHRIGLLFEKLGVRAGDVVLMVLPRVPEW